MSYVHMNLPGSPRKSYLPQTTFLELGFNCNAILPSSSQEGGWLPLPSRFFPRRLKTKKKVT